MPDAELTAHLAACQERFATSLVGTWHTAGGTFDAVMQTTWEFRPDGTATVTDRGDHEDYRWESCGPFQVRLGFPPDDDSPAIVWARVLTYELAILAHDAGREVVLRQVGKAGFWLDDQPLRPA